MPFEWINIKKQKPMDGQEVLITTGRIVTAAVADLNLYYSGRITWDGCHCSGYECDWDFDEDDITHWMPMPKPPNVKNGKE